MVLDRTNGLWVVGDTSGRLSIWNIDDNHMLHLSASGHTQVINDIALTHDSRFAATLGRDQVIRFWTLNDDYRHATEFETDGGAVHDSQVWALAFSPDSRLMASADRSGKIILWEALTGKTLQVIDNSDQPVWSLLFSTDSRSLLVGRETEVASYSVVDGTPERVVDGDVTRLTRLVDSGDGESLLSTSASGKVKVHKVDGSEVSSTLFTEGDIIWSVAVDQQRQLVASASGNETVGLYKWFTGGISTRGGVFQHRGVRIKSRSGAWSCTRIAFDSQLPETMAALKCGVYLMLNMPVR